LGDDEKDRVGVIDRVSIDEFECESDAYVE